MTDPAVEAARRTYAAGRIPPFPDRKRVAAAREALAPLRDVPGLLRNLATIQDQLVMDTEQEQQLNHRHVEMLQNAAENVARLTHTTEELKEHP